MNAKKAWEATFDAIVDPLAIVDLGFRIVRTNLAHARYAQKDVRTLQGRLCHEVIFNRTAPCEGCPLQEIARSGEPGEAEVVDTLRGRTFRVSAFPKPKAAGGDVDSVVCHYKDVTEEKELQRKLLQNEKMAAVGTLAGGVAHEINNPLGAILAFSQLGLRDCEKGTVLHEFMTEIEDSARRCQRIVMSLLDFSRPSGGERKAVDLHAVVKQAAFLCKTQFGNKGCTLVMELPEVPTVMGDRNQLGQVVVNLLANAYQALDGTGEIRVGTLVTDMHVELYVEDNGPGIPERYVEKVFEPFFTTKPEGKGTGLGLSISYSIVVDHGALIEVDSTPGVGTRFLIRFPRVGAAGQDEPGQGA